MSLSPIVASIGADTGDVTKQSKGEKGNKQYAYKTAPIAIEKQTRPSPVFRVLRASNPYSLPRFSRYSICYLSTVSFIFVNEYSTKEDYYAGKEGFLRW